MKLLQVGMIAIWMTGVGLVGGYYLGKQTSDKWWLVHAYYLGNGQLTSWPTVLRQGRTNEQIIADLHASYPTPQFNNAGTVFTCPPHYYYTSLHYDGDKVKNIEVGGLYIGICLPKATNVSAITPPPVNGN